MTRSSQAKGAAAEDGAVLIIALVIITVFALLIGLILSEAQVAFKSTEVTGTIRNMTYAADGGIESGIKAAQGGQCSSPSSTSTDLGSTRLSEPGVNPTVTVLCQTTSGNSLNNTFGGAGGSTPSPGYSVVTNSTSPGCIGLATDAIGASNQIKYAAASHCATFGTGTSPVEWSAASSPTTQQLNASTFVDASDAWAVGNATTILSYDGSDWTPVSCTSCPNNLNLNGVSGVDSKDVYAVGNGGVILFDNGSDNWQLLSGTGIPGTVNLQAVWAGDANDAWAAGSNGKAAVVYHLQQVSAGVFTVLPETLPTGNQPLNDITGIANSTGGFDLWAVGQGGYVVESSDSGATWTAQTSPTNQNLQGVTVGVSASGGALTWAVGAGGVIMAAPDGAAWTLASSGTTQPLNAVWAVSNGTAGSYDVWAVGNQGVIDYSAGSTSWALQTGPATNVNLQAVGGTGYGAYEAHAFGQNGSIWDFSGIPGGAGTPTNNGPPWVQQASGTTQTLNEIAGVAGGLFVVGNNQGKSDTVLVSTNGTTWSPATVNGGAKSQPLLGVSALSATQAWAVGGQGQILATTNGTSWSPETSPTTQQLNSVFALDSSHIWAVGNNQGSTETILFSGNGGGTWTAVGPTVAKGQPLEGVWASDAGHVWAVGGQGQIYYSATGGTSNASWSVQASGTTQMLNAISGLGPSQVWAVGNHAGNTETILAYDGTSWSSAGVTANNAQNLNDIHAISNAGTPYVYAVGQGGLSYIYNGSGWVRQPTPKTVGGKGPKGNTVASYLGTTAIGAGIGQAWAVGPQGAIWNYNPYSPTGMAIDSGGSIFNAGGVQLSSVLWASDAGYVQGGQPSCSPPPTVPDLYYVTAYSCSGTSQLPVTEALPTISSTAPWGGCVPVANNSYTKACLQNSNPAAQKVTGCPSYVQFTPGIYNAPFKFAPGTFYFFQSGLYYFDNVGNILVNGNASTFLVGGTPASSTPAGQASTIGESPMPIVAASPCWTYAKAHDSGNANGVELIFGGNTDLQIQNGNVELFSRANVNPAAGEGAEGISIREACSPAGSDLSPTLSCAGGWDPGNIGGNDQIVRFNGGGQSEVDIHGSIYTPDHNVELYSNTNPSGWANTVGAVDCWSLELASQNYASPAVEVQAAGPLDIRTIIVTATTTGGSGTVPVQEEAFAKLDSPAGDNVEAAYAWRYCTPVGSPTAGCSG